ncbi:MAG TPA: hypothetical protein VK638_50335 [Edaphobacter sp.]|nr:hypothetical protein [Edaphobacter sp.]
MALGFASIGHFFASAFHDIIVGAKAVEKAGASLATNQQLVEDLTSLIPGIGSQAAALERIAFGVFGQVAGVAATVETAAAANGINVQFDAEMVADIKALIAEFPNIIAQAKAVFPAAKA